MTGHRRVLFASLACVIAATAWAQEPPAPEAAPDRPAGEAQDEAAPAPAAADDAAEALRKEAQEAAAAEGGAAEGGGSDEESPQSAEAGEPGSDEDGDFIPSEKIWADSALAFPSDI